MTISTNFIEDVSFCLCGLVHTKLSGGRPIDFGQNFSFFVLLENSLHVWGHYVLNFYKAIATRNAPKKGPKNGGYR